MDDPWCTSILFILLNPLGGAVQGASNALVPLFGLFTTGEVSRAPDVVTQDAPVDGHSGSIQPNEGVDRWRDARVDCHEIIGVMSEGTATEDEDDFDSQSSEDKADDEGGIVGGIVSTDTDYVPSRLDCQAGSSLVLAQEHESSWAFDADTLLVGQHFPHKATARQAIVSSAVKTSRTYRVYR